MKLARRRTWGRLASYSIPPLLRSVLQISFSTCGWHHGLDVVFVLWRQKWGIEGTDDRSLKNVPHSNLIIRVL